MTLSLRRLKNIASVQNKIALATHFVFEFCRHDPEKWLPAFGKDHAQKLVRVQADNL